MHSGKDLEDAGDVLTMLRALHSLGRDNEKVVGALSRKIIDGLWDAPRKTMQGKRKYARNALWSPHAAMRAELGKFDSLVDEHVVPFAVQYEEIANRLDTMTARDMADALDMYPRAIVTEAEARAIDWTSGRFSMPEGWDGKDHWARYRKCGFDPDMFVPFDKIDVRLCGAEHLNRPNIGPCTKYVGHVGVHTGHNPATGRKTSWSRAFEKWS